MTESRYAFPATKDSVYRHELGMTLRDYYAGQAMVTMAAPNFFVGRKETVDSLASFAEKSYRMADAMLAERAKGNSDD